MGRSGGPFHCIRYGTPAVVENRATPHPRTGRMKMMPVLGTPPKSSRRSVALITLAFVFASAALHVLLGGMLRPPWMQKQAEQSPRVIVFGRVETPPPTPIPRRTPRPQPSERPMRTAPARQRVQARTRNIALPSRKGVVVTATTQPPVVAASPVAAESLPPVPEANATPIDARDIIISARFIHRVEPDYPQLDIDAGVQGTVIVLVTIGPDGTPSDLRVWQSSGDASLDRAALEAARSSTFAPPEVDGQPATQTYRIIYTFYLD